MHHRGGGVGHTTEFNSAAANKVAPTLFKEVGISLSAQECEAFDAKETQLRLQEVADAEDLDHIEMEHNDDDDIDVGHDNGDDSSDDDAGANREAVDESEDEPADSNPTSAN